MYAFYIHKSTKNWGTKELMIMMMMLTKVLCIFPFLVLCATMAFLLDYGRYFFIYKFSHLFLMPYADDDDDVGGGGNLLLQNRIIVAPISRVRRSICTWFIFTSTFTLWVCIVDWMNRRVVTLKVQIAVKMLLTDGTNYSLRIMNEPHVLTEIWYVGVDACTNGAWAWR